MPQNTPGRGYTYPCYSDLANFPAQMQEFANDVDTDVATIVNNMSVVRSSAKINRVAALSVPNATSTLVPFDTGTATAYWPGSGSTITLPITAVYVFQVHALWATSDTGQRQARVDRVLPSAFTLVTDQRDGGAATAVPGFDTPANALTGMVRATAGTTVVVRVTQNSGAALNLLAAQFSIMEVSQ